MSPKESLRHIDEEIRGIQDRLEKVSEHLRDLEIDLKEARDWPFSKVIHSEPDRVKPHAGLEARPLAGSVSLGAQSYCNAANAVAWPSVLEKK
jgi:hypothetical protein